MGFDGFAFGRFGSLRVAGTCVLLPLQCDRNAGKRLGDWNLHAFVGAQFPHLVRAPKKSCASICGRRTSHLRQEAFQRQTRHTKHVILQIILLTSSSKYKKRVFTFFSWLSVKEQALPARINLEKACHIFSEKISVFLAVYTVLSFLRAVYAKRMKVNTKSAASKRKPRAFF